MFFKHSFEFAGHVLAFKLLWGEDMGKIISFFLALTFCGSAMASTIEVGCGTSNGENVIYFSNWLYLSGSWASEKYGQTLALEDNCNSPLRKDFEVELSIGPADFGRKTVVLKITGDDARLKSEAHANVCSALSKKGLRISIGPKCEFYSDWLATGVCNVTTKDLEKAGSLNCSEVR